MAGNKMGAIKRKLGLKGSTKPGEMISRMNKMKMDGMTCKTKSMKKKSISAMVGDVESRVGNAAKSVERYSKWAGRTAVGMGKSFVNNALLGHDLPGRMKQKSKGMKTKVRKVKK